MFCFSQTYIKFPSFKKSFRYSQAATLYTKVIPQEKGGRDKKWKDSKKDAECDSPFVYLMNRL